MTEAPGVLQVVHQKVLLDIALTDRTMQGCSIITAKARSSAPKIKLNAHSIIIKVIRVNGSDCSFDYSSRMDINMENLSISDKHAVEQYKNWTIHSDDYELTIDKEVLEGDSVQIEISYQVSEDSPSCLFNLSPDGNCTQLVVLAEREQARHWIPCIDNIKERCKWDLELSIEIPSADFVGSDQLFIVGSGALIQQIFDEARNRRVFSYKLDIPVPAAKIGFVAGLFEMHKIHGIPNAHLFCPAKKTSNGNRTGPVIDFLVRAFGYLNWLLNTRYPWAGFYLVFARDLPRLYTALPNLVLLPTALLHDTTIIDQTWETRRIVCGALIEQYYFCKALPNLSDRWIIPALCRYLALHQLRVFHGNNDYRLQLRLDLERALELDAERTRPLYDEDERRLFELDPYYAIPNEPYEWIATKGRLVLVLLEQALGKQNIQKILMQLFIDANVSDRIVEDLFSINYLHRCIKRITGKDMKAFLELWLLTPGFPIFDISFAYNRKKSCVEFDINQSYSLGRLNIVDKSTSKKKPARFTGALLIRIHETDTAYDHVVHIEEMQHHFELPFHTKIRKPRQSKKLTDSQFVPEDKEMADDEAASSQASKSSPISWVRIDPEVEWIARIRLSQSDFMWTDQLAHDRDVIAQWDAITALGKLPSEPTCKALDDAISDFRAFHKIRSAALLAMSQCSIPSLQFLGTRKLLEMFTKRFGLKDPVSGEVVPRASNFENLTNYYLLLSFPLAICLLRDGENKCPEQALSLLLGLLKYNDNSSNVFSDYHYIATVVICLSKALHLGSPHPSLIEETLKELDRFAFLERILPSHRNEVMISVLNAIVLLQASGLCSYPMAVFQDYFALENYVEVRMAAAQALLKLFPEQSIGILFNSLLFDPSKSIRRNLGILLLQELPQVVASNEWFKDLLLSTVKQSNLTGFDQLRHLARKLYPDITERIELPTPPVLTLTLPSPKKVSEHGAIEAQADWVTEISEGVPLVRREVSSGFTSNVQAIKPPKLRLAIGHVGGQLLKDKCGAVIDTLWENSDSYPFRYSVDPSVPHYYDIIQSPMDLTTLKSQIDRYNSPQEFIRSLRLIFDNCFQFNHPHSMIYNQAKELRKQAVRELKRVFPELKGAVKDLLSADLPIQEVIPLPTFQPSSVGPRENKFDREDVCRTLMSRLYKHSQSFWFLHPVDPVALNIPTYFDIVKEPMDFGTITGKLDTGNYDSVMTFLRDLKLVFANCSLFNNATDPVCNDARTLEKIILEVFSEYAEVDVNLQPPTPKAVEKPVLKLKLLKQEDRSFEEPCRTILRLLSEDEQAGPFLQPVIGVPGYSKVIRRPMDLSTVSKKLEKHTYSSASAFKADLDLIWQNCSKFNGSEAPITTMAQHLSTLASNLFNEFGLE